MGKRRAAVLVLIHVAIAIHIIQWKLSGKTVSPVEPSEAMQTLEIGRINAGFIFFAVAILATFLFGRFFCGWGCHVVALQDFCGFLMKKIGVRPRLFRSRFLVLAPLGFGFYMFAWPTVKRALLLPLLREPWPAAAKWLGEMPPFPGFSDHIMEENFWQTFPSSPWVIVPFLFICGFAVVYLLGAKAFCTYGCPYGGIFGPVDRVTPARILVNPKTCEQCGHCTATCTSNVRVHEEVHLHGMVVDSGCMKCLDCVNVCPNDALSFGFARPLLFGGRASTRTQKRKKTYDLTLGEDIAISAIFVVSFVVMRGAYQVIPLLMAIGMALCMTFLFWKAYRLFQDPDVSIHQSLLKQDGAWKKKGMLYSLGISGLLLLTIHTGWIQYHWKKGETLDHGIMISRDQAFGAKPGSLPEDIRKNAEKALAHYEIVRPIRDGGKGLLPTEELPLRMAWLNLVAGRPASTEELLRSMIAREGTSDFLATDLSAVLHLQGKTEEAREELVAANAKHPEFPRTRDALAQIYFSERKVEETIKLYQASLSSNPQDAPGRARLASLYINLNRIDDAVSELELAVKSSPDNPHLHHDLGKTLFFMAGKTEAGLKHMEIAAELAPNDAMISDILSQMKTP